MYHVILTFYLCFCSLLGARPHLRSQRQNYALYARRHFPPLFGYHQFIIGHQTHPFPRSSSILIDFDSWWFLDSFSFFGSGFPKPPRSQLLWQPVCFPYVVLALFMPAQQVTVLIGHVYPMPIPDIIKCLSEVSHSSDDGTSMAPWRIVESTLGAWGPEAVWESAT